MANTNYEFIYTVEDYSGVSTGVVMPAGQARWFDTVTGLDADRVVNLVGDGAKSIATLLADYLAASSVDFPIGYVYWQLPGKDSPSDMSFTGTWANISSTFAGDFFRAEGGDASTFNSGQQADQMQGHWHQQYINPFSAGSGAAESDRLNSAAGTAETTYADRIQSPITDGVNGTPRTGTTTYPVNRTIRLWERTA